MTRQWLLLSILLALPAIVAAHPNPGTVVEAPDPSLPAAAPAPAALPPMAAPAARSNSKVTIFTARKIVTLDPMQPEGTAVAVQDGRILSVGTLAEVKGWVGSAPSEVDTRFGRDVILPGFVEAHMHPQITGLLWQGVYVGRFDRYTPDGQFEKGLLTRKAVVEKLAAAAKQMGDNDNWLIAWGYQPEFYDDQPLTVTDLDPVSGKHPVLIENASMHIYYVNTLALDKGKITAADNIPGVIVKDGKPTGEFQELAAVGRLLPSLPKVDDAVLKKATWNAAKLAHQVGVTTIADASFGTIPGAYKAYQDAAADPDYPVRTTLYPMIELIQSKMVQDRGGLDYVKTLMKGNNDRLAIGAIKFVTDGSIQGMTANLNWPYYYKSGRNGVANMTYPDIEEWVGKVHAAGLQAMIHTNGDQATEWGIRAIEHAQALHPRIDHRHRLDHNQMVNDNQLERMATQGIATNLFINHVYYWGDLHPMIIGPDRAARLNPLHSALRHGVRFATHSDASVTRLDPLLSVWVAATRKTLSGKVLGPAERITVAEALRMVTIDAAFLMKQDDVKGTITQGKLADFVVLKESPLDVPVDRVRDIGVIATVLGGKVFPVTYKRNR